MKTNLLGGAAVALALSVATPAFAQSADAPAPAANSGDIVVTATRQSTLLSKTPVAMTAVTGDSLRSAGITDPRSLAQVAPNLSITESGDGVRIAIRRVTSTDGTEKGDPSAAFLADGIYLARPQAQEVSFFDVERVEVLRGPQGTLYGRNTTAGVVNVITASPKHKFGASADASYESFNHVNGTATLNVPVAETFALRAAVNYDRRDTYVNKTSTDKFSWGPFKDVFAARLSALWEATPNLKVLVKGDYSLDDGYGVHSVPITTFFSGNVGSPSAGGQGKNHNKGAGVMGQIDWNVSDSLTATYLGSYRTMDRYSLGSLYSATTPGAGNRTTFTGHYWQTSHEARLAFKKGPVFIQAGGYYFKEQSGIAFFILDFFGPNSQFGFPQDPTKAVTNGAFAQGSYNFTDNLKLTAGVRYSSDDKSRVGATVNDNLLTGVRTTFQTNNASRNFSKTTWRVGVDYDLPGIGLLYANVATGYKAGGFNDGCEIGTGTGCALPASALYYQPETLTAYEIGAKARLFDNKLRLNFSAFHYNYNNLQLTQVGPFCAGGTQCTQTTNAASAKVDGIEAEGTLAVSKNGKLDVQLSLLDARYGTFYPNAATYPTLNFANVRLDRSPTTTLTLGYTHTFPMANGGEVVAGVRSKYSTSYSMLALSIYGRFTQPAYTQTEVNVTYNSPNKTYYVQAYG
ncbi:hypothetical protein E4T56_gene7722, partial [Termitomyces sp. T112]